jgi:hypothetical protein
LRVFITTVRFLVFSAISMGLMISIVMAFSLEGLCSCAESLLPAACCQPDAHRSQGKREALAA